MNMFDAIWKTYSVAGRLPFAEQVRAPLGAGPMAGGNGGSSVSGGAGPSIVLALSRNVLTAAVNLYRSATDGLVRWHKRQTTIHELSALDDRLLKDIGVHRSEIRSVAEGLLRSAPASRERTWPPFVKIVAVPSAPEAAANDNDAEVAA